MNSPGKIWLLVVYAVNQAMDGRVSLYYGDTRLEHNCIPRG